MTFQSSQRILSIKIQWKQYVFLILGPPGSGKSTTAARMAKNHGMIYYEGDSVLRCLNPFPDPTLEPVHSALKQKPLKVSNTLTKLIIWIVCM